MLYHYKDAMAKPMEIMPGHPSMIYSTIHKSASENPQQPVTSYFVSIESKNVEEIDGPYDYNETFFVISGILVLRDHATDKIIEATAGDVVYLQKGHKVSFSTPDKLHMFVVAEHATYDLAE
jgi:ethanolamine utilization protein EutQ (cupin superfamily)